MAQNVSGFSLGGWGGGVIFAFLSFHDTKQGSREK